MFTAIAAAVSIQLLLAILLFGTDRLERVDSMSWLARHPLVRRRSRQESARSLAARQATLEQLGAATRRASSQHAA